MWAFCSFGRTYNIRTAFQNSPLWPLCRAGVLRAADSWLPSAAPPLGELCAPGGRAKSVLCSLSTQAFLTRQGMGAVGPAWRSPLDGQTAPVPQPLRALFWVPVCACTCPTLHSQGGRGGITGHPLRHSTLQSGWCVAGVIVPGLVTIHPVGLWKRTLSLASS